MAAPSFLSLTRILEKWGNAKDAINIRFLKLLAHAKRSNTAQKNAKKMMRGTI